MAFTNFYPHSKNTKQHDQTTYPPSYLQYHAQQHLDTHNILHDTQHGFRKHRSTETQLIQLIDNLAHTIDNRIQTDAILLDFQKSIRQSSPPAPPLQTQILWQLSHHKHSTGYTHSYLTAHSRSVWRAICLPPSTSLLESPKEVFSALSSS